MILLDYRDRRPIYEQIVERFVELMVTGVMPQDSQMPSVRSMAVELSINPNTIQRAYAELERQGYIYSVKGKGSFVAENRHIMEKRGAEMLKEFRDLAEQARSLGLEKEQLLGVIRAVYERPAVQPAANESGMPKEQSRQPAADRTGTAREGVAGRELREEGETS